MTDLLTQDELTKLQDALIEELGVKRDQLLPEADLSNDLGADSLTKVEITMRIEEMFNLVVPDEQAERVQTVEDIYDLVGELLGRDKR